MFVREGCVRPRGGCVRPKGLCLPVSFHLPVCPFTSSFLCPFTRLFSSGRLFVYLPLFICPSVRLPASFVSPSAREPTRSVCPFVHYPLVRLSVYPPSSPVRLPASPRKRREVFSGIRREVFSGPVLVHMRAMMEHPYQGLETPRGRRWF